MTHFRAPFTHNDHYLEFTDTYSFHHIDKEDMHTVVAFHRRRWINQPRISFSSLRYCCTSSESSSSSACHICILTSLPHLNPESSQLLRSSFNGTSSVCHLCCLLEQCGVTIGICNVARAALHCKQSDWPFVPLCASAICALRASSHATASFFRGDDR